MTKPSCRKDLRDLQHVWCQVIDIAQPSLRQEPVSFNLALGPHLTITLAIAGVSLEGWKDLLVASDDVLHTWNRLSRRYPGCMPDTSGPPLQWWFVFLELWRCEPGGYPKPPWLSSHLQELAHRIAVIISDTIAATVLGAHGLEVPRGLITLRSAGGRRQPMDPLDMACVHRVQQIVQGSSTTVAKALVGAGTCLDLRMSHTKCVLFFEGLRGYFGSERKLCIIWDPGTYSGFQYNMGAGVCPSAKYV